VKDESDQIWRDFFRKYHRMAVRYALSITKDEAAAEDTVQEAAATVYRQMAEGKAAFESHPQFRHYFFKTVKNMAINLLRSQQRESTVDLERARTVAAEGTPLEDMLSREADEEEERRLEYCLTCLKTVKKKERDVILMRFFQQMSYEQISARIHVPLSTVRYREKAVLRKLKKKVEKKAILALYV